MAATEINTELEEYSRKLDQEPINTDLIWRKLARELDLRISNPRLPDLGPLKP